MSGPRVGMLDLRAQHAPLAGGLEAAIARVVASGVFVRGPEVEALEQEVAALCETPHAVACGSGSDAILLALMAHGIGPGDRVVCPAWTFFSTAAAITRLGAVPVFADVDPAAACMGPDEARAAAARGPAPRALIAVHLFGRAARTDALLEVARELGVPLVEDAAQAIGARDEAGRPAGSRGASGCLSFYPSKNLGAFGDAGMVLERDAERAARLRVLRDHGAGSDGLHHAVGINSRLDAIQAAVLRAKLPWLETWTTAREERAARYHERLGEAGAGLGPGPFEGLPLPVRLPAVPPRPARHVFHHFVIRVPAVHRDPLRAHLAAEGIESGVYYPTPLHQQPCFATDAAAIPRLPHAEAAAQESLAIPVHPELGKEQQDRVVAAIRGYFER